MSTPYPLTSSKFSRRDFFACGTSVTTALAFGVQSPSTSAADAALSPKVAFFVVGDTHYGRVEDVQMNILHMICYAFVEVEEARK